ncbi:hypothetical protein JOC75_000777 [Metabacillus crassostreae]|nr:hypothetical protein [Metabacillus crassostreae]MBM7602807.1 hypothetical protein [Metabacillus crassostreae]
MLLGKAAPGMVKVKIMSLLMTELVQLNTPVSVNKLKYIGVLREE